MKHKLKLSIFVTAVFVFISAFSGIPAQAATSSVSIPVLQIVAQPQSIYRNGESISFIVSSPNYGGKVQYRVVLYNGTAKKTSELWNTPETGYYYTGWMPSGDNEFTIRWPVLQMEPGAYRMTVLVRRSGSNAVYDSHVDTRSFWVVNDSKAAGFDQNGSGAEGRDYTAGEESYALANTHTYEITDVITVKASKDSKFDLNYNIGSFSESSYQQDMDLDVYGPGAVINTTRMGNKTLNASSAVKAGETVEYRVVRKVKVSGINYIKDISNTSGDYSGFSEYGRYTASEEKIESANNAIAGVSGAIFSGITNPYLKAKKAYEFVNKYMTYDSENGNKSALSALLTGRGVCEDYSELFAALLRAGGVPVRIATGYWVEPSDFETDTVDASLKRHSWPEFYIPEFGWVVAEPTQTYTINGQKEVNYDWFANLNDSDHFIQGYDFDGEFRDGIVSSTFYSTSQNNSVDTKIQTFIKILE